MKSLPLSTLCLLSGLGSGYQFYTKGTNECGCAGKKETRGSIHEYAQCIADAVAGSPPCEPSYEMSITVDSTSELWVGTMGKNVMMINPKVRKQVIDGILVYYSTPCLIDSVQLGNVPTDGVVSADGIFPEFFFKVDDINFHQKTSGAGAFLQLRLASSREGNTVLVTSENCNFTPHRVDLIYRYGDYQPTTHNGPITHHEPLTHKGPTTHKHRFTRDEPVTENEPFIHSESATNARPPTHWIDDPKVHTGPAGNDGLSQGPEPPQDPIKDLVPPPESIPDSTPHEVTIQISVPPQYPIQISVPPHVNGVDTYIQSAVGVLGALVLVSQILQTRFLL